MTLVKMGAKEHLQIYGVKLVSQAASCDFCFCFWVTFFVWLFIVIITGINLADILLPIVSTPLAKKLTS